MVSLKKVLTASQLTGNSVSIGYVNFAEYSPDNGRTKLVI